MSFDVIIKASTFQTFIFISFSKCQPCKYAISKKPVFIYIIIDIFMKCLYDTSRFRDRLYDMIIKIYSLFVQPV